MTPTVARRAPGPRRRQLHPLAIAFIVIALAVAITYYAFNQGLPFVHHFTLNAIVNNSVNIRGGSPVRIAGIDVGSVSGTSPDGNATKVSFTVSGNGQPIHKDATVRVRDRLFLEGGYYLELDPGSPEAPVIADGSTIPLSQTSTPVQFYKVLSTFDISTRASLKELLNTLNEAFSASAGKPLSAGGAGGLKLAIPQLTPVFKDTAIVTRALRGTRGGDVQRLLGSSADVTGTLAANSSQLVELVSGLNATSSALASSDGALAKTVSGVDETLKAAPPALAAIDHALPPVANLAVALDPSLKVAPPILDRLTSTVSQLAAVLAPVERGQLLSSLKATFQEFPALVTELGKAFPITNQVTDCLLTHVIPILKETVPDGSLSTGRPVWQDFLHFLPGVAGATGVFDANGPFTRTLVGAGTNTLGPGVLGKLPLLGQVFGTAPPGGGTLAGTSPSWVGDLTSADFRPDVSCATQKLPSLAAPAAAPDLTSRTSPPAKPLSTQQVLKLASAAVRQAGGR